MQLTFPSKEELFDDALSDKASTAANLRPVVIITRDQVEGLEGNAYEEKRLSIRGLNMNSLFNPPSTDGCVS
jgi:hypothetical protein